MALKKELNFTQKMKKIYILRRVGLIFIVATIILIIISIILFNSIPESVSTSNIEETASIIFKTKAPYFTPEPTHKKTIIIYHTHNDESYYKGDYSYKETTPGRSFNENYNVISVGQALKNNLDKYNKFHVIHDKSNNVSKGFNYAYDTSFENIKKHIGNADIFIDIHRDAYAGNKSNYIFGKLNKEYAYIRFVVANGKNYENKPNYDSNLILAKKLHEELNLILPGISKGIIEKDARLNQHISESCLLIEIGNEKNDITQVINSTEILAEAFNKIS